LAQVQQNLAADGAPEAHAEIMVSHARHSLAGAFGMEKAKR
jgi:hypothetical protein